MDCCTIGFDIGDHGRRELLWGRIEALGQLKGNKLHPVLESQVLIVSESSIDIDKWHKMLCAGLKKKEDSLLFLVLAAGNKVRSFGLPIPSELRRLEMSK